MTNLDLGVQGAKRQSSRLPSPRELLRQLIEKYPDEDRDEMLERYTALVMGRRKDCLPVIIEYWLSNNWKSLHTDPAETTATRSAARAATAKAAQQMHASGRYRVGRGWFWPVVLDDEWCGEYAQPLPAD